KFEISYPLPMKEGDDQKYLIPSLVRTSKPSDLVDPHNGRAVIKRKYRFEFLPLGFLSRLIIRLIHFMEMEKQWKDGCIVKKQNVCCLVEYNETLLELNLEFSGNKLSYVKYLRLVVESI